MKTSISSSRNRRRGSRKGSAMVESSLIFLAFFVMVMAAIDFGQFLFIHQALTERARSAARWGAINTPTTSSSIVNMVLYNQATDPAGSASTEPTPGYLSLSSSNVTVSSPNMGTDNARLIVVISGYRYSVLSPYIAGTYTGPAVTVAVPLGLYN